MNIKDFLENYEKISNNLLENVFFPLNKKKEMLNEEKKTKVFQWKVGDKVKIKNDNNIYKIISFKNNEFNDVVNLKNIDTGKYKTVELHKISNPLKI